VICGWRFVDGGWRGGRYINHIGDAVVVVVVSGIAVNDAVIIKIMNHENMCHVLSAFLLYIEKSSWLDDVSLGMRCLLL
jgi:hypothetical protein